MFVRVRVTHTMHTRDTMHTRSFLLLCGMFCDKLERVRVSCVVRARACRERSLAGCFRLPDAFAGCFPPPHGDFGFSRGLGPEGWRSSHSWQPLSSSHVLPVSPFTVSPFTALSVRGKRRGKRWRRRGRVGWRDGGQDLVKRRLMT